MVRTLKGPAQGQSGAALLSDLAAGAIISEANISVPAGRVLNESSSRHVTRSTGCTMKSMSKFGADRIVAGAIIVTVIALIAMYINGTWAFPFP